MKIKSFFKYLSITLMVVCCAIFLLSHVSGFGWKALAIPTGSMRPNIPPGSLVLVHSVPYSKLQVGDVITYANPLKQSDTITHRITKTYMIDGKIPAYITKGDANPSPDLPVVAGQVQGKLVWRAKNLGFPILYSKDPVVILPIIYIAAILIMIEEVQRLADYYKRWIYRLPGYDRVKEVDHTVAKRVSLGGALTTAFVVAALAISPSALAALKSNTVTLANNRLSVGKVNCGNRDHDKDNGPCKDNDGKCDGDHDADDKNCNKKCVNNVHISNNTTQTAKTGDAHSSGSGNAISGNARNSSSTNINISTSNNSSHC